MAGYIPNTTPTNAEMVNASIGDQNVSPAPPFFDGFAQGIDRIHVGQIDSPEREAIFHPSIIFVLEFSKAVLGSNLRFV